MNNPKQHPTILKRVKQKIRQQAAAERRDFSFLSEGGVCLDFRETVREFLRTRRE